MSQSSKPGFWIRLEPTVAGQEGCGELQSGFGAVYEQKPTSHEAQLNAVPGGETQSSTEAQVGGGGGGGVGGGGVGGGGAGGGGEQTGSVKSIWVPPHEFCMLRLRPQKGEAMPRPEARNCAGDFRFSLGHRVQGNSDGGTGVSGVSGAGRHWEHWGAAGCSGAQESGWTGIIDCIGGGGRRNGCTRHFEQSLNPGPKFPTPRPKRVPTSRAP